MAVPKIVTPYGTATAFAKGRSSSVDWMDVYDNARITSYDLYDDMFHNTSETFSLLLRSIDEKPILIPTAANVVRSLARYIGKSWGFKVMASADEDVEGEVAATDEQIALAQKTMGELFNRERMLARYRNAVPEWLRRGDWLWFVSADPLKKAGSRISVRCIDPRRYFPVNGDVRDLSRVTGQQLIEEVMVGDKFGLFVQTWLKSSDPDHPDYGKPEPDEGFDIVYSAHVYEQKNYSDPIKRKKLSSQVYPDLEAEYVLGIKNLPIYHIRNNEESDDPFGRSELAGIETVIAGMNQSMNDEDMSLALMGLGMYWTDSGAPVDEATGQTTNWRLGPNYVVEVDEGKKFNKVPGIDDVQPFQDHVGALRTAAQSHTGLSDVSIGTSSSATAESGIALAIKFSPTLDTVAAKNDTSNAVLTQMFHDLKDWFRSFEDIDLGPVEIISVTESKNILPFDREERWNELMTGISEGLFTIEYAVGVAEKEFGYEFDASYAASAAQAAADKAAATDPFATRAAQEISAAPSDENASEANAGA